MNVKNVRSTILKLNPLVFSRSAGLSWPSSKEFRFYVSPVVASLQASTKFNETFMLNSFTQRSLFEHYCSPRIHPRHVAQCKQCPEKNRCKLLLCSFSTHDSIHDEPEQMIGNASHTPEIFIFGRLGNKILRSPLCVPKSPPEGGRTEWRFATIN
jgi:hypothetical protein